MYNSLSYMTVNIYKNVLFSMEMIIWCSTKHLFFERICFMGQIVQFLMGAVWCSLRWGWKIFPIILKTIFLVTVFNFWLIQWSFLTHFKSIQSDPDFLLVKFSRPLVGDSTKWQIKCHSNFRSQIPPSSEFVMKHSKNETFG